MIASLEKRFEGRLVGVVADVGCGGWTFPRNLFTASGNTWYGVDPSDGPSSPHNLDVGPQSIKTHDGSVGRLPFEAGEIDLVVCNQSMEHWHEYGNSFASGLSEIHRVLKSGGAAVLNVPIHYHGHPIFVKGQLYIIRQILNTSLWRNVEFRYWGRFRDPEDPYRGWNNSTVCDFSRSMLRRTNPENTWMLEIYAVKSDFHKKDLSYILKTNFLEFYCKFYFFRYRFLYRAKRKILRFFAA